MARSKVRHIHRFVLGAALLAGAVILAAPAARGGDWPQWRGANRDAKVTDFKVPQKWPKELTQKWKVAVGEGVATPALVGDKLFVFSWEGGKEILRCLEAGVRIRRERGRYCRAMRRSPISTGSWITFACPPIAGFSSEDA